MIPRTYILHTHTSLFEAAPPWLGSTAKRQSGGGDMNRSSAHCSARHPRLAIATPNQASSQEEVCFGEKTLIQIQI
jgi:hypothetical protein